MKLALSFCLMMAPSVAVWADETVANVITPDEATALVEGYFDGWQTLQAGYAYAAPNQASGTLYVQRPDKIAYIEHPSGAEYVGRLVKVDGVAYEDREGEMVRARSLPTPAQTCGENYLEKMLLDPSITLKDTGLKVVKAEQDSKTVRVTLDTTCSWSKPFRLVFGKAPLVLLAHEEIAGSDVTSKDDVGYDASVAYSEVLKDVPVDPKTFMTGR